MTRRMNRRQLLGLLGAAGTGAIALAACSGGDDSSSGTAAATGTTDAPATEVPGTTTSGTGSSTLTAAMFDGAGSCALTPEQTEGPYYVDVNLVRADIREDRDGVPLRVGARVLDADGCTPIKDAVFEIWHCDADGVYSGFDAGEGERYLRGAQVTNADGIAAITTIYPGWYPGRTAHIHAKVLVSSTEVLTTQLYFDEALSTQVYAQAPYNDRTDRAVFNPDDGIFDAATILTTSNDGDGYLGLLNITVQA
jgi:protocatechuate 3,4-dioxygenase beta subunit